MGRRDAMVYFVAMMNPAVIWIWNNNGYSSEDDSSGMSEFWK